MLHARVAAGTFFAVLASVCVSAQAATLAVTSTGDAGAGTLRATLASAGPGDTIVFNVTGTIALASPLPIGQSVTIKGPGAASLTLDGQSTVVVMNVAAGTLTLSDVTIAHAKTSGLGGGIALTGGAVTVARMVFNANNAGNGGAISAGAGTTLIVNECTFSANTATSVGGGALINSGTATLSNSTFLNNTAPINGGAINTQSSGTTTVINSTFVGNTSVGLGGATSNLGITSFFDSTFSANTGSSGGALATGNTTLTIDNNVFADNVPDAFNPATGITGSNNVFYNNSATLDPTGYGTTNFVVATTEPLGTLGNHGGPTQTQVPSGAALCAGAVGLLPAGLVRDQRGSPRIGTCLDAGAVEVSALVTAPALSPLLISLLGGIIALVGLGRMRRV